ncbi:MAG TPA: CHASE4 domain-containing protein [Steroidobacteraceae bacterium]|nr:CHASE4 domain-containing protein [Steroidobacteraceae bacterium]
MKIRPKVIASIAAIFVALGLAQVLVEKFVVTPSFAELERADARTAMRRISFALDLSLERLTMSASDWGNWADTYRFVQEHNPDFPKANLDKSALRQLNVNALLIVDLDGNVVQARDLDLDADRPLQLDLTAAASLPASFPWRDKIRAGLSARGLVRTSRGTMMLAGAPILDGTGHGPTRGMVLLGRLLSPAVMHSIAAQAQTELTKLAPVAGISGEKLVETDELTQVYQSLDDIYGHPIMTLRVDVPRNISARGHSAVLYATVCILATGILALIVLVMMLNRAILNPLAQVTRHAVALSEDQDLTTRLNLKRKDEFGVLAREFDRMVDRVATSRMQLVDQSYEAGFAELAKGVLHNLGNAMTPISVRLANLAERLRVAPDADIDQAISELQDVVADPERKADLEEFLRLACRELAHTVRLSREDVAVITRQTAVIQTELTEQLRSARNDQVIEPVRLTELVSQSLEIVPDSARARLTVEADETLRKVGVVRVARTVLRLVLQNLIINAADAVRDSGKAQGTLRLSAEILHKPERTQLHLECRDDGVGISAQNLERVFEKGFTTKSRETNHGIGLHWCANAVGALGGRIWAASEGPGCGASLHLLIPLATRDTTPLAGAA